MKKISLVGIVLAAFLSTFLLACGGVFEPTHADDALTDRTSNTGIGTLRILIPSVSALLVDAFATLPKGRSQAIPSRALFYASRVELELRDSRGVLIDEWTGTANLEFMPNATTDATRTVAMGTGYSLTARLYNNKVSEDEPVVTGSVSGIEIVEGAEATVAIPCIPNATLFPDTISAGSAKSGSLTSAPHNGTILTDTGGESWFRIRTTAGVQTLLITASNPNGAGYYGYLSLYREDGTYTGYNAASVASGDPAVLAAPVIAGADYFLGLAYVHMTETVMVPEPIAYSLSLVENNEHIAFAGEWSNPTFKDEGVTWTVTDEFFSEYDKNVDAQVASGVLVHFDNVGKFLILRWTQHPLSTAVGKFQKIGWIGEPPSALTSTNNIFSSAAEAIGDTGSMFTIPVMAGPLTSFIVANGDFSDDTNGWNLHLSGSGEATLGVVAAEPPIGNMELKLAIAAGGTARQDLALFQDGLVLESGKAYSVTCDAHVSSGTILVGVELADYGTGGSMVSFGGVTIEPVTMTQHFEGISYIGGPTTTSAMILFRLLSDGVSGVDLYLDNIGVEEIGTVALEATSSFTGTPSGRNVTLDWAEVPGASGYIVTRKSPQAEIFTTIWSGSALSYTDQNITYDADYEYQVIAQSATAIGVPATLPGPIHVHGKPVSGTIVGTGITNAGSYPLFIMDPEKDNLVMTGIVSLDSSGAGSFSINGGEWIDYINGSEMYNFVAFIDLITGPMRSGYLNTGDIFCMPGNWSYDETADDGTITDVDLSVWSTAGTVPILARAGRSNMGLDSIAWLNWWDLWNRPLSSTGAVTILRKTVYTSEFQLPDPPISDLSGYVGPPMTPGIFTFRSGSDMDAENGLRHDYRIGVDIDSNGVLDAGEYAEAFTPDS